MMHHNNKQVQEMMNEFYKSNDATQYSNDDDYGDDMDGDEMY